MVSVSGGEQGNADAQLALGNCYHRGEGVQQTQRKLRSGIGRLRSRGMRKLSSLLVSTSPVTPKSRR